MPVLKGSGLGERGWLFGIVAIGCVLADFRLPEPANLFVASLLYLLFSIWLSIAETRSAMLVLNPVCVYQWWQTVVLGAVPLYLSLNYGGTDLAFGEMPVSVTEVAAGHAVMVVGAWAFYLGMKKFQPSDSRDSDSRGAPSLMALLVAAGVGVGFSVFYDALTPITGSSIASFSFLPVAVVSLLALNPPLSLRSRKAQLFSVLFGSAFLLLLGARRDSKMGLILSFFPLIWWLLVRRKYFLSALLFPTLLACYVLLIAPLVTLVRDSVAQSESGQRSMLSQDVNDLATYRLRSSFSASPAEFARSSIDQTINRLAAPVAAGVVYTIANETGFLHGAEWNYLLAGLVPRVFWSNKPIVSRGRNFTAALHWAPDANSATTATGETVAGELFWNFGWPGVVIGMFLLGAATSRLLWRAAGGDPRIGVLEMMIYVSVMLNFVQVLEGAASPVALGCITCGIYFNLLIRLRSWMFPKRLARRSSFDSEQTATSAAPLQA